MFDQGLIDESAARAIRDSLANGETLDVWLFGPTGLERIAEGLAVWTDWYGWEADDAPLGWYCFAARVTPGD